MDLITYALSKKSKSSTITNESLSVQDGELVLSTDIPYIGINFETRCLETNSDIFSIKDNSLISEV